MAEFSVLGSFEENAERMRAKYEGVVDRVGFYIPVIGGVHEKKWEQVVQTLAA